MSSIKKFSLSKDVSQLLFYKDVLLRADNESSTDEDDSQSENESSDVSFCIFSVYMQFMYRFIYLLFKGYMIGFPILKESNIKT